MASKGTLKWSDAMRIRNEFNNITYQLREELHADIRADIDPIDSVMRVSCNIASIGEEHPLDAIDRLAATIEAIDCVMEKAWFDGYEVIH